MHEMVASEIARSIVCGRLPVHVRYASALEAGVDLSDLLDDEFYATLKDKNLFAQVKVHYEMPVLVWPNDIDLVPELLYERATNAVTGNS